MFIDLQHGRGCKPRIQDTNGDRWSQAILAEIVETGNNTRMFCEGSLGKMQFRTFQERVGPRILSLESVGLITLEQVNTSVVEKKR